MLAAALTRETARWAGSWADGLITTTGPADDMRKVKQAFEEGGGLGEPIFLQAKLSYAAADEIAYKSAVDQWKCVLVDGEDLANLSTPEAFENKAREVPPGLVAENIRISSDRPPYRVASRRYRSRLRSGFLHNVNLDQRRFISDFGAHVLPAPVL